MKIGIIGAGAIGKKHAEAAHKSGAQVGWVVDVSLSRAQELAAIYGAESGVALEDVLADPSTNAVAIGIPNWLHKSVAIDSMTAGKDVLLEKPMAMTVRECEQIAEVAEATERVLQIGFVHRYTGVGLAAKEIVDRGEVGEIYHAKANLFARRGVPGLGNWFTTKELAGGGALIDVGVHLIDLAMHIMDFPAVEQVLGQTYHNFGYRMQEYCFETMWGGPPNYEGICDVEDLAHALIRLENGATIDLHVAWAGNYPSKMFPQSLMAFTGEHSGIAFELFGTEVHQCVQEAGRLVDRVIPVEDEDFFLLQMKDFMESVRSRQVLGANAEQGKRVQAIVESVYQSSKQLRETVL